MPTGVYPFLLVVSFMHLLLRLLDWWIPRSVRTDNRFLFNIVIKKNNIFLGYRPG